jgi:hypothetical protein
LYGCETWCLTVNEEHGYNICGNGMMRRTFGPKGRDVTRSWRELHVEELHNLYSLLNVIKVIK